MDERLLIARAVAGDAAAERELYEAHVDRVFRLVYRLAGDEELAQDFTQEAFIRAFGRLSEFRGDAAFSTWLHAVAVSVTLNGLRKVKRFRTREVELEEALSLCESAPGAEPDLKTRLRRAIDALPELYRVVFVMHDVEGYTHEEIGEVLGVPPGTSKARLQEQALFALSQHRSARASQALRGFAEQASAPEELREKAVFWLGQQRSPENAEFLRGLFRRSTSPGLKEKILFSLSQMRGQGNERWLLEVAVDEKEPLEVRKKALFWAGQNGAPITDLVDLYDRIDDREMREQLIFTYSQRKDPAAVDKLMDIVRTERDRDLREKALFWLGQSEDPRVVEFFQEILAR